MSDTTTANVGLVKPAVGASLNSWGDKWNANLNIIDRLVYYMVPLGSIGSFAGGVLPPGWLLCDGSARSRTTYSDLFGAIGTTFGAGNGSTTFNVPDLRARVTIGAGAHTAGATTRTYTLGQAAGNFGTIIAQANLPNSPILTQADGAHQHSYSMAAAAYAIASTNVNTLGLAGAIAQVLVTSGDASHTHSVMLGGGGQKLDLTSPVLAMQSAVYAGKQAT